MANWQDAHSIVSGLAGMPELTAEACARILGCELQEAGSRRYRARDVVPPFGSVDVRIAENAGLVVLDLDPASDQAGFAAELAKLGEPEDIDQVSPPVFDPARPDARPAWDRKYSFMHTLCDRPVWYGIEERDGEERLVSISIHYDTG